MVVKTYLTFPKVPSISERNQICERNCGIKEKSYSRYGDLWFVLSNPGLN